jgi:hypothetical protein
MRKKTGLRKTILTRYIECMVLNGVWIENVLGVALIKFNYDTLINRMEEYTKEGSYYTMEATEIAELRQKLEVINLVKAI